MLLLVIGFKAFRAFASQGIEISLELAVFLGLTTVNFAQEPSKLCHLAHTLSRPNLLDRAHCACDDYRVFFAPLVETKEVALNL